MSCLGPSRLALGSSSKGHHPVESWFRMGSTKADYSKLARGHVAPGQGPFSDGRAEDPAGCSDSEDEEPLSPTEDVEAGAHDSPNLTNLFASALTRTTLKGGRSRKTDAAESSRFSRVDRPMRKDRSTSAERRELGKSNLIEQNVHSSFKIKRILNSINSNREHVFGLGYSLHCNNYELLSVMSNSAQKIF